MNLIHGDCSEKLKELADNSVDSIVSDPPSGISFMGKSWDSDKGGRNEWIKWMSNIAKECLRVIKPGGHALVWAIPRTSHWTATAWEDGGWEVRDICMHIFGSGFPKSHNISKSIDGLLCVEREIVGVRTDGRGKSPQKLNNHDKGDTGIGHMDGSHQTYVETVATSDESKQWDGWGTALKPACEHWILFRKPIEGTVAENILKWGVGGINIDGCRVVANYSKGEKRTCNSGTSDNINFGTTKNRPPKYDGQRHNPQGRWPANVILSHHPDCRYIGTDEIKATGAFPKDVIRNRDEGVLNKFTDEHKDERVSMGTDGKETIEVWDCHPDCPIKMFPDRKTTWVSSSHQNNRSNEFLRELKHPGEQGFNDSGSASRFFYCAKASKRDREEGCEGLEAKAYAPSNQAKAELKRGNMDYNLYKDADHDKRNNHNHIGFSHNNHPTVKSTELMKYLCRLITPQKGIILDPFMGSGSTGKSAILEGFDFIGIEQDESHIEIAKARIDFAKSKVYPEEKIEHIPKKQDPLKKVFG